MFRYLTKLKTKQLSLYFNTLQSLFYNIYVFIPFDLELNDRYKFTTVLICVQLL